MIWAFVTDLYVTMQVYRQQLTFQILLFFLYSVPSLQFPSVSMATGHVTLFVSLLPLTDLIRQKYRQCIGKFTERWTGIEHRDALAAFSMEKILFFILCCIMECFFFFFCIFIKDTVSINACSCILHNSTD